MATEEEQAQNEIDLSGDTIVETGEDPRIPEFTETRLPEEREEVNQGDLLRVLNEEEDAFKRAYAIEHPEATDEELERVASEHRADMAAIPSFSKPGKFARTFVPGETLASLSHGESYKEWIGEAYDVGQQVVDDISSGAIGLVDGFVAIGEMALGTEKTKRDVEEMVQTGDLLSLEGDVKGYNEWLTGGSALIAGTAALASGLSGIAGKPLLAQLGQLTMAGFRGAGAFAIVPYVVVPMASEVTDTGAAEGNLVYRWYQWGPAQIQNYLERNISNVDALKQYVVEDAARLGVEDPEQYFEDEYNRARNTRLQFDYWVASRDMNLPEEEQDRRKQDLLAMDPGLSTVVMFLETTGVYPYLGPDKDIDDILHYLKTSFASGNILTAATRRMVADPVVEGLTASFLRIQEAALSKLGGDAPVFAERDKFIESIGGVLGGRPELDEIIQHVQAVQEEPERARDLLPKIERLIMIQSYNSLPDEVKKDQPPAGRFVEIANTIQPERLDDPSFTQGSPSLIRAVKAVHDGKSEEEVQDLINEISFGALTSIFVGHPETFRAVIPTDKELLGWAEKQAENRALVGGLEARKMTQAMGAVSLDVGEVYAQENALGTLFRFANAAIVGWGEADLGKTDDPLGSGAAGAAAFGLHGWRKGGKVGGLRGAAIGGALGLIYSEVGTPAAMDFHHGYGFRDPDHSWFARWLGRMNSGSGDLPVMYREIFLEGDDDPSDLLFKLKMLLVHAVDFLVPAEAPVTRTISGVYGKTSTSYATLKTLQNSPDTPVGHLATAVISPWVYSHWQGLTDSDPFTVINHLALVGAKSSRLQGKSAFSMLNKIQQEQVLEAVRMVGVDPTELTGMEVEEAIRTGRIYRTNVKRLLEHGSPERLALRKSEEYIRVKAELQRVVDAGNIKQHDADAAMLFHEDNAFTAVLDPRSRVDSVTGYFNSLRYEAGGKEAPGATVFRQEDPEAAPAEVVPTARVAPEGIAGSSRLAQVAESWILPARGGGAPSAEVVTSPADVGLGGRTPEEAEAEMRQIKTGVDLAEFIAKNADDPVYRRVAHRIKPHLTETDVHIISGRPEDWPKSVLESERRGTLSIRQFNRLALLAAHHTNLNFVVQGVNWSHADEAFNDVFLRARKGSPGTTAEVALHELVHAATNRRMKDGLLLKNKGTALHEQAVALVELRDAVVVHAREEIKANKLDPALERLLELATINIDEFVAYGLTSKGFQDYLMTVKVGKQSAWSAFVQRIADLLGISKRDHNALTELLRLTEGVLDAPLDELSVRSSTGQISLMAEQRLGPPEGAVVAVGLTDVPVTRSAMSPEQVDLALRGPLQDQLRQTIESSVAEFPGVRIKELENVAGIWKGGAENSALLILDGPESEVRAFAAAWAVRRKQGAALIQRRASASESPNSALIEVDLPGIRSASEINQIMVDLGIEGGTTRQNADGTTTFLAVIDLEGMNSAKIYDDLSRYAEDNNGSITAERIVTEWISGWDKKELADGSEILEINSESESLIRSHLEGQNKDAGSIVDQWKKEADENAKRYGDEYRRVFRDDEREGRPEGGAIPRGGVRPDEVGAVPREADPADEPVARAAERGRLDAEEGEPTRGRILGLLRADAGRVGDVVPERGRVTLREIQESRHDPEAPGSQDVQRAIFQELGSDIVFDDNGNVVPQNVKIYPLSDKFGGDYASVEKALSDWTTKEGTVGSGWRFMIFGPGRPPNFKEFSYPQKVAWIYDPFEKAASFEDNAYTLAWRATHEIAHGIVNDLMTERFRGVGKREGALGIPTTITRTIKGNAVTISKEPLSLADALRALEWEHETFYKQREILEQDFGIKISDEDFAREYAINMSDAVYRVLSGRFSSSAQIGANPRVVDPTVTLENAKNILRSAASEMGMDLFETYTPALSERLRAPELPGRFAFPEIPNDPVVQKVSDLMDGIEAIKRSDEIVEHEMGWHHSARAVGPKVATEQAMAVDGFEAYSDAVSNAVRQQFGNVVNVYGLMTSAEYRAWVSGDDTGSVQVSLRPKEASLQIESRYKGRDETDLVLVHFETVPENIIMRDGGEKTFVLDLKEVDQSRSLVLEGEAHPPVSNAPIQVADVRAIMNDIGMNPDDPVVLNAVANAMSEKRGQPGKRVLETMTDAELNVLAGKLLDGKVVPTGKAKKVVSKKSAILKNKRKKGSLLNKFWKREIESQDGVPKTLLVRTRFKPTKGLRSIPLQHKERAVANVAKHADSPSFDGAGDNERNWGRHMANLSGKTKDNLVLAGPKKLFEWVENPQAYVDFIDDGVEADGGSAMRHAREGLELTDAFIEQFRAGQVDANTTGLLAFWGFLSRGVSPYPQEAGFIDGVFAGVEPFIDLAVRGEFDDAALARYLDWAADVSPKGGDTPGSGVRHNINAFGKNFLKNMGKKIESGENAGKSKLALFHGWLGDAEKSGTQIRRDYMAMAEGAGLGTKVVSFILMLSGRKDVIVLDRWMIRLLWDADNPVHGYGLPEIYEGFSRPDTDGPKRKVRRFWFHKDDYIGTGKKRKKATGDEILKRDDLIVDFMLDKDRKWSNSRGLSNIVTGTRWLAVQEAIEHKLQQILPQTLGRIAALRPEEINLATFHWLTWNTVASQGAAHASLQALLRRTMGHKDPFLGAYSKEGRYRTYDFGLQYINLGGGKRRYLFTDRAGEMHILTPDSLKTTLDEIRRHASVKNVENRVVPHGFKVTDDRFPNIPWRERPSVNADNLEAIFRANAEPTPDSETIGAAAAIARGYVGAANFGRGGVEPDDSGTFNHMGPRGVLGQFEWNSRAGRGVIRFFENANETTLFHENAHALVILMGRAWRDRLVRQFDSAEGVDRYGRRTGRLELTRKGHEQAAESLAMYWLTKTASPAGINKMFDQLYLRLRELWATIRNEPLTEKMNPQMRLFWDQTLRVQEAVRPRAEVLTHSATKKGRPVIRVAATPQERVIKRAVEMHGKRREGARIDLNPEHIRQALGLTYETYRKADGSVGRRIAQREVDAVELLDRAVAYVITEGARKQYKGLLTTPLVRLTARSMVPEERVEGIQKRVKNRIKQAVGVHSSELGKNIASTKPGSRNEVVNRPNIDPFYDPSYRYEDLPTDYIMLTDRQAAGFKTMVHEVAAEPITKGNISDRLLQPDADFRLVPIDDYNAVLESVIDLESGVGARTTGYALRVPPTLGYAFVNALGGLSAKLVPDNPLTRKLEYWKAEYFTAPEVIGDELMDPTIKGIIEQTIRELNDIPNWVRRVVRDTRREDGKERTLEAVYRDLVEMLIPPIKLDHARRLVDMHNDLKGALRIATPGAEGKEFIPLTRKALNGKLNDIQGMLQDGPGMSDRERASLTLIRTYERVPSENLTPQDLFAIGDAVSTITDGLRIREESISLRGKEIAMALEGSTDKAVIKNLLISDYLDLYEGFFTGDFLKLFDIYSNKGRDVVKNFDQTTAVLEMITRMRANNIIARLSRRMVEAEYLSDVEGVLKDRPGYPRFGYDTTGLLDRIDFYIHQIINWDQYIVFNEKTGPIKVPREPPESAYSMHELAARRQDPEVRSKRDIVAYNAASDILNKWGFKVGKGTWTKHVLPDGTETLLPALVIKEIEDATERAAHVGAAWMRTPKGAKGSWRARVYKRTVLSDRVNIELDNMEVTGWDAKGKIGDALETIFGMNPISANAIRLGVTVGFGLVHPAYYAGVLLGTALAVQQTQGAAGFLKAMGRIPVEAGRALVGQPGIVGAVMGRMWKEGAYSPEGPALVTQDGRIYTTGALSQMAMREGLKGSFIMAETARSMAKQFQDAVKAEGNPSFLKTVKGVPKWWLQTCIEVVTAFDNYFRVGIFVDELSAGKSPSVAADRAKTAAFDYSALSDFERTTMRFVVMFYSYMRKNMDLFYDTLLRNPSVILGQLRLLNGFQSSQLEGEPQIVLPTYMQSRLMPAALETMYTAHRHQAIGMVLPPINLMDMLSFMSELYNLGSKSDAVSQEALRMLVSRTTPWVQTPFVLATEKDIFFGRELDRKPNQVPPWLVEWDLNVTGGVLYDFLGIKPVWATRPQYDDVPGRMIYVARNAKAWWLWRNMVQIPMAGRSVDTITALDRSNIGAVEFMTMLTHEYAELTEPLYKQMGWLAGPEKRHPVDWDLPEGDWRRDTMLPRADMMAIDEEGQARPTDFSWIEFAGFLGLRAKYIEREDQAIFRLYETKRLELEASIKKKEPTDLDRE